ncbi:MAG: HEPN domain-containing protein, partial [Candidatus Thermoplasmatota archaeon]|nr:HEPN domain-containing protein [Candidatus Thermoplasmatota archaeon]
MNAFERCIAEKRLVKVEISPEMIKKELESADYDYGRAMGSLKEKDAKWASIQAYYSIFHAAKALVLSKGYREKGHACLQIALKELFPEEKDLANDLEMCMDLRHGADYASTYDAESAKIAVRKAGTSLE